MAIEKTTLVTAADSVELQHLFQMLQGLETQKVDIIAGPHSFQMSEGLLNIYRNPGSPAMKVSLNNLSMDQLCQKLTIPPQYAEKLLASLPTLLDDNINGWLRHEVKQDQPRNFMLRTYSKDGNTGVLRAVLSDKYFDISTFRLMNEVLAVVAEMEKETGFQIKAQKCDLTNENIFVRFIVPELEQKSRILQYFKDGKTGNQHSGFMTGIIFKNSETGRGMYSIAPRIITGASMTGNIFADESVRRMHIGERLETGTVEWSKETIEAEINSIMAKTRDGLRKWLSPEFLAQTVSLFEAAAETRLAHPIDVVVNLAAELTLNKRTTKTVLEYLNGCGMGETVFGVVQAFTGAAKEMSADDRWKVEDAVTKKLLKGDARKYDHRNRAALKFITQ